MNRRMFLLGITLLLAACSTDVTGVQQLRTTDATVRHSQLEGGFYYLDGDDGVDYDPINLSTEYRVDGKRVRAKLQLRADLASIHQFGLMAEIVEITAIQ